MRSRANDAPHPQNGVLGNVIPAVEPREVTLQQREVTPEQTDLIAKITQVPLTRDGYRTLNLVFEHLRQRKPEP